MGGALLMQPLPARAITVIPDGATISTPDPASFGRGDIVFQGGTLEVTADAAFMPSYDDQQLLVGASGGTLAVATGKTLNLNVVQEFFQAEDGIRDVLS